LDRAVVDLVGDLAAYRPAAKVVILEGASDTGDGFDVTVVRRLFPEVAKRVNLVSGGAKLRVRGLYGVLATAAEQLGSDNRFFSITDRDRDPASDNLHMKQWDRYHIENYLLEPSFVRQATRALTGSDPFASDEEAKAALRASAMEIVDDIAVQLVRADLNDRAVGALKVGAGARQSTAAQDLASSLQSSAQRLTDLSASYDASNISDHLDAERGRLATACASDDWIADFPGRDVLKRYARDHAGVKYEAFVNIILDRMAEANYQPPGMKSVLEAVLAA